MTDLHSLDMFVLHCEHTMWDWTPEHSGNNLPFDDWMYDFASHSCETPRLVPFMCRRLVTRTYVK